MISGKEMMKFRFTALVVVGLLVAAMSVSTFAQEYSSSKPGTNTAAKETESATNERSTAETEATSPSKQVPNPVPGNAPDAYVIGEQDVLNINVWKEPEISGTVVVRPDGKITVPLINEVYVVGLTPIQLQNLLAEKLKPFVNVPQVTVVAREINSRKVYLIGNAGREGPFRVNSSMTVLQLIAEAGGLRDFAKRKSIYIMRNENGQQQRYKFNYDEVIQGKRMEQNIILKPGDTVVVP